MKRRPKVRKVALLPSAAAPLCAEVSSIGEGETPVRVTVWQDGRGKVRRVWATYPNGWLLRFSITAGNCATRISMTLKFRVTP